MLVNHFDGRGDAVVVTASGDPVAVPLDLSDFEANRTALLDAVSTGGTRARRVLTEVLAWLWEAAVEPVVAVLPLHAAGPPGRRGALDAVVSSYIPTIRALEHARRRPVPTVRRGLTVAVEHTPGLPRLPGTIAEARALHAERPDEPMLIDPTVSATLAAVRDCTWAHFACHATTDPATSSRAVLHLGDGTLPVEAIGRLGLAEAELAYLSACSTASRDGHVDEPLNLASAFHLAGFRHVVASLWPLDDAVAAHAAESFYRLLPVGPAATGAARAVRAVARELRADRPDLWAALVHSGP